MASEAPLAPASGIPKGTAAALQLVKCKVSASLLPGNLVASSKFVAYIHRNEVQLIDQKLVALGNDKAETLKAAYAEKDAINQIEFIKTSTMGEILVVINQGGGVYVRNQHIGGGDTAEPDSQQRVEHRHGRREEMFG